MRKVLSFVLVLSLVLGSFGMAFAATPKASDIAGKDCAEAVTVLTELNVVSGYADGTYKPENIVTRAEMATLIVKALGLSDYAVGTSKFTDCAGHWANGYIAYANSLGIISGRTATTFDPDATVSYDEAATMIVKALGWNDGSLVGTYPANYVTKAKTLGILDGIKAGATGANRGDIAIMIYQALDAEIGKTNKDGDWVKITGDTMLARLDAELYKDGKAFVLDENAEVADGVNVKAYYGASVIAYQNSDDEIIAIKEVKSTFLTGKFTVTSGTYKFEANDVEYALDVDAKDDIAGTTPSAVTFVNGETEDLTGLFTDKDDTFTLAVDVSGKKIKEVFSASEWTVKAHGLFNNDEAEAITEDQELLNEEFKLDDDDEIDLTAFALVGAANLDALEEDDVVYVYSNSEGISRIEVGTEVVTGEVTRIRSDKYTINGTAYEYADIAHLGDTVTVEAGDEVTFYLDNAGDIYSSEAISGSADKLAILIASDAGSTGLNGSDTKFKMFLADGTTKTFSADQDEMEDAGIIKEITNDEYDWDTTGAAIVVGSVVKYDVDKDGLVNDIELADKGNVTFITESAISAKGNFNGYAVASDATIFTATTVSAINSVAADDDEYGVTTLDKVKDTDELDAIYYYDKDSRKIVWMVINEGTSTANDVYAVVNDWGTNKNDAGYDVDLFVDGKPITYDATKKFNTESGSNALYTVKFDTNGDVNKLEAFPNFREITSGTALTVRGSVVTVSGSAVSVTLDSSVIVYVYEDDEWTKGGTGDIKKAAADDITVTFFDVDDPTDKVADIVLVYNN